LFAVAEVRLDPRKPLIHHRLPFHNHIHSHLTQQHFWKLGNGNVHSLDELAVFAP
jgi:hypothetical protein